jgi:DNA-binding NtrC family response regulator/pSer/pThr/pTyr-binding forkhead associated (FHA) protein
MVPAEHSTRKVVDHCDLPEPNLATYDEKSAMASPHDRNSAPEEAITASVKNKAAVPGLTLRVLGADFAVAHPLPVQGEVVIGRSRSAEIRVDDESISRRHAILRIGQTYTIEDLESANGTRVGGLTIEPGRAVEVAVGEPVELGSVLVVLQAGGSIARTRRLWTHGYFEARLEEECARAERTRDHFAVIRLHVEGLSSTAEQEAVSSVLRVGDVVASYAPGDYELLALGTDLAGARHMAAELAARLGMAGATIRSGIACYPLHGRTPDELVMCACRAVAGAAHEPAPAGVIVLDEVMRRLHRLADRVAQANISVLLLGETGVGKEVLAEQLHRRSPRAEKRLLRLNCAALPEALLESELFGHEKGAFTGAQTAKPGLLESADGGTVFLDEVGELPMAVQVKLLRVFEDRKVTRVGAVTARPVDIRFIAATNRDLESEVARQTFRRDLYFRLNGIALVIPPLRERPSEIEALAKLFAGRAARELGRPEPGLHPDVLARLRAYAWPGNVRELRNIIERAVVLCVGDMLFVEHLPLDKMGPVLTLSSAPRPVAPPLQAAGKSPASTASPASDEDGLRDEHAAERQRVIEALEQCAGNQTQAARLLGISRTTLVMRLEAYRLPRPRKKPLVDR